MGKRDRAGNTVAANLLKQDFTVSQPGTRYVGDITYSPTAEGWLYLAGVKDLATREIIGHAMGSRMTVELTQTALQRAIRYRRPQPGCIHHSDQGSQYLCALLPENDHGAPNEILDVTQGKLL